MARQGVARAQSGGAARSSAASRGGLEIACVFFMVPSVGAGTSTISGTAAPARAAILFRRLHIAKLRNRPQHAARCRVHQAPRRRLGRIGCTSEISCWLEIASWAGDPPGAKPVPGLPFRHAGLQAARASGRPRPRPSRYAQPRSGRALERSRLHISVGDGPGRNGCLFQILAAQK